MKRTLTSIVAATMVLGTAVPAAFAAAKAPANDISNSQYAAAINLMVNQGVFPLYSDGAFRPTLDVSRGQFVAYLYNVLNNNKVITKHYTEKTQPYTDVTADFRNQINDMYLYGFLNNVDLGNGALGQNYKSPKWWIAQVLCNIASISYDSSNPWDALNKARAAGFFDNTNDKTALGDKDADGSLYYMSREEMAQVLENFYNVQYPGSLKGIATSLTVSAKADTIAYGTADQLTVSGKDISGAAATIDPSQVTYSVDKSDTGFVNGSGVFTATAPGVYTVTATVGAFSASTKITVYGQVASFAVSAAGDLVADATSSTVTSSQTVTVKVYDAGNNVVQNYNGPVTLTSSNATDASVGSKTAATASQTVNAVNGVATFTVYALNGAKAGDTPTLTASTSGSTATGSSTIKVDAAQATGFSVDFVSGQPKGLSTNSSGASTQISALVIDQAGANYSAYTGYVTATISGPATFPGNLTTEQVWVGAGQSTPIFVQGNQGQSGNVVVTLSATGLQTATFTIPAYVQTGTSSLTASASTATVAEGGTSTVTFKALDGNGNLALAEGNTVTVSGLPTGVSFGGAITLTHGYATATLTDTSFVGTATLTFSYTSNGVQYSTSLPFTFTQGGAVALKQVNVSDNVSAPAGTTQPVTFQLVDAASNAVKVAGDTFTISSSLGNTALSATSATTDANGQFTVNLTLPQYVSGGTTAWVEATPNNAPGVTAAVYQHFTVDYGWNLAQGVTANVYDTGKDSSHQPVGIGGLNNTQLSAGEVVYLDVYGVNGSNAAVPMSGSTSGDSYTVTSSNPAVVSATGLGTSGAVTGANVVTATDGSNANLKLTAGLAGTAVITITDTSVVGKPTTSFTVNVASTNTLAKVALNGLTTSTSSPTSVTPGKQYALTVQLTDAGGNPVFPNQGTTYRVSLGDGVLAGDFRNANGAAIDHIDISDNVGSAVVYWVAPASASGNITLTAHASGTVSSTGTYTAGGVSLSDGTIYPLTLGN